MSRKNQTPTNPGAPNVLSTPFEKRESRHADALPPSFYCKHCNGTKRYLPVKMALVKIITKVSRCKRL